MADKQDSGETRDAPALPPRDAMGRLLAGGPSLNPAGRPRGSGVPTFGATARAVAESQGTDLHTAMRSLLEVAMRKAAAGDNDMLKMLLAKLPDVEPAPSVQVLGLGAIPMPLAEYTEAVARTIAELEKEPAVGAVAAERRAELDAAARFWE